jgi:solute carrier family 15 (peptide/histidine transporter), member 3/4
MLPAAWLMIFDQIIIIILIPLLDKIIYPILNKKLKMEISVRSRILIGMLFGLMSILSAGGLETYRLNILANNTSQLVPQFIDNTTYFAANLTILWQIPQYTFSGISEVFCSVTGLYFAYSASPKSMRSIIMGLFYLSMGIGSFLGSLLIYLFGGNFNENNLVKNHLDYYFYCLSGILLIGIVLFLLVDTFFSITKLKKEEKNLNNLFNTNKLKRPNYQSILRINPTDASIHTKDSPLNSINSDFE